jgi:hypothetical protein
MAAKMGMGRNAYDHPVVALGQPESRMAAIAYTGMGAIRGPNRAPPSCPRNDKQAGSRQTVR